ncbi:hypothetical protein BGZ94_008323 [Podila epigama]|nr:hypothetical protein BGZ94_008323 [Podila epigama]
MFNLGGNDRKPNFTGASSTGHKNPLADAINPANTRGADMFLTPDHPSWNGRQGADPSAAQNPHSHHPPGSSSQQPGFHHDPHAPYTGGRISSSHVGPHRAGPDNDSFLPPGAVPQGARFSPIMPDLGQQSPHPRNQRQPGHGQGQGNGRGHFTTGGPDNDEFLPPH